MAYDERLAERIRAHLAAERGVAEKEMFGGLCFLVNGHMACGIVRDTLMVRVGPEEYERALAREHAREMNFTGRPLRGMVYVAPDGLGRTSQLATWIDRGVGYVRTLPAKPARKRARQ
ncbi:MAG: TfoX/Sxy family protein [Gemmatimonadales bacterium]